MPSGVMREIMSVAFSASSRKSRSEARRASSRTTRCVMSRSVSATPSATRTACASRQTGGPSGGSKRNSIVSGTPLSTTRA